MPTPQAALQGEQQGLDLRAAMSQRRVRCVRLTMGLAALKKGSRSTGTGNLPVSLSTCRHPTHIANPTDQTSCVYHNHHHHHHLLVALNHRRAPLVIGLGFLCVCAEEQDIGGCPCRSPTTDLHSRRSLNQPINLQTSRCFPITHTRESVKLFHEDEQKKRKKKTFLKQQEERLTSSLSPSLPRSTLNSLLFPLCIGDPSTTLPSLPLHQSHRPLPGGLFFSW